jgi:hypothetical protein
MDDQPTEADIKEFQELRGQLAETYYSAIGKASQAGFRPKASLW